MTVHKPSVYLDTSVINFLFADDAPDLRQITEEFFENVRSQENYRVCVSEFVIQEVGNAKDQNKKDELLGVLKQYPIEIINTGSLLEIERLAGQYLEQSLLPPKKLYDALHVAFCVIERVDYLASWNYKHLANVNRERRLTAFNFELGYLHPLRIVTPHQLADYEE